LHGSYIEKFAAGQNVIYVVVVAVASFAWAGGGEVQNRFGAASVRGAVGLQENLTRLDWKMYVPVLY
jgi:hypothetical protein